MRLLAALLACLCAAGFDAVAGADAPPSEDVLPIVFFTRPGCPHCEDAKDWLDRNVAGRRSVRIEVLDIANDPTARPRLLALAEETKTKPVATPAFYLRGVLVVGWAGESTGARVLALLEAKGDLPPGGVEPGCSVEIEDTACEEDVDVPLFGRVRLRDVGLPLFTAVIGLVDGFNPCAMWVLLFLLSILVNLRSRKKMFAIAGTFVLVSGIVYFAFMAAWLNFFFLTGYERWVQVTLGLLALFVGAVHVKDFFAFHKGLSLSIPESAKPGIYARARAIVNAEHLAGAIGGVVALAFLVNAVELLCTAGLPAIYTNVLTKQKLPTAAYYGYLGLYQVFYMFDDAVMLAIAVVTLSRRKLQERGGRVLKLVSGVVILVLGLVLILKPEWLFW